MLVRSTSASYRARLFPDLPMSLLASLSLAVGVGIIYFTAARLSLALLTKPDGVAVLAAEALQLELCFMLGYSLACR